MFATSFFVFSRRIQSLKSTGLTSYPSKFVQFNGYYRYARNCSSRLLIRPKYDADLYRNHFTGFNNEFRIIQRCKHTSSDKEKSAENISGIVEELPEKLSLFKRYKKMLKEYWYVLLPVHCVTSVFWFGGFYYAATCGLDIVPFLEYINLPEKFINPLRSSSLGYIAVASAIYKLATPARYMVTVGGTTFAVKFLTKRGLIRPAPTKAELKTYVQKKLKTETSEKQP